MILSIVAFIMIAAIIICLLKYPFEKYYKEIEEMKSNLDM